MQDSPDSVRVLHVDDEPDFAELAADFLERERDAFEVEAATSASEGLDALDEVAVDCVVSDYDMPGRDGIEFLEAVREEYPGLPFILFTGKGSEEVASDAISAGVTDYLQKQRGTEQYAILANRIWNAVQRARAEGRAERSRDRLEGLSAAFPDVAFFIDEDGRYVDVYAGTASQLAYDEAGELVGERFHDILPTDIADRFLDTVQTTIETGEFQSVEYQLDVQAGTRWFEARTGPLETTEDGRRLVVWVARDITDRKERERELERYEALTQETTDIITVLGENGTIRYESPSVERVLGYEPAEVEGENAFDYIHPGDQQRVAERFATLVGHDGDATDRVEYRFRAADGSWTWLEAVASSQTHETLDGHVITSREITPKKERERELERKTERLDDIEDAADSLAAELGALSERFDGGDADDEALADCRERLDRAESLAEDVLDLAAENDPSE